MSNEESTGETEYDFSLSKAAAWNDRPTLDDGLEWENYIEALYEFITHEETNPPLTISIDGKWGVGKTSFMLQLEHKLRQDGHFTVNFNPWRHQDADPLWGAFMLSFLQQLLDSLSFRDRMRGRARLYIRGLRSDWTRLLRPLATLVVTIGVLISVVLAAWLFGPVVAVAVLGMVGVSAAPTDLIALGAGGIGSLVGGASWLAIVWKWSERRVVDPVHAELQRYLIVPRYEDHVSFIEHFHEDLSNALEAYTGPHDRRVFVFIDDLDRCDIPEAARLMESINLMLSDDHRLVFLIGMDREKVSAGIAAKYEQVRKILTAERGEQAGGSGVDFGEDFIDKFIQVPFAIPRPNSFSGFGSQSAVNEVRERIATTPPRSPRDDPPALTTTNLEEEIELSPETQHTIVERAARTLEHNPRRFKKFVNMFRLYTLVAHRTQVLATGTETELILPETGAKTIASKLGDTQPKVTVDQLAKFVIIRLRWKRLVDSLYSDDELLARLSVIALRRRYWRGILTELDRRATDEAADIDEEAVPNEDEWQSMNEQLEGYEMQDVSPHRQSKELPTYLASRNELDALLLLLREGVVPKDRPSTEPMAETDIEAAIEEAALSEPDEEVADADLGRSSDDVAKRIIDYIGVDHFLKPKRDSSSGTATVDDVVETLNEQFADIVDDREGFERAIDLNAEASLLRVDSKKLLRIAEMENFPERSPDDRAFDLFDEGYAAHEEGQYEVAREKYSKALELFRELDDGFNESMTLHNMGLTWEEDEEGDLERALSLYEDSTIAAIWADEPDRQVRALAAQGNIYFEQENYDEAHDKYREASLVASANDLFDIEVDALGLLGDVHKARDDYEAALERYEQAFAVAEDNFNYEGMVRALGWQGGLYEKEEGWEEALERYERAETIAREHALQQELVNTLHWQGLVKEELDAYDEALERYEEEYDIARADFDYEAAVDALGLQGDVYERREAYDEALACYEEAETIARDHDLPESVVMSLHWQGLLKKDLDAFDEALERYERAHAVATENDDHEARIANLGLQGDVYEELENYDEANARYEEAESIAAANDLHEKVVETLQWQGFLREDLEADDEALQRYEHAQTVAAENGDYEAAIDCLSLQGDIYEKRDAYDEALECYQEAQAIAAATGNQEKLVYTLQWQGLVYEELDAYDVALGHYEEANEIATAHDMPALMVESLDWQGAAYETLKAYETALARYEEALSIATEHQLRNEIAEALFAKASVQMQWEAYERSHALFEWAREEYEAVDDDAGIAYSHANIGFILTEFGKYQNAREHLNRSLDIQRTQLEGEDGANPLAYTLLNSGNLYSETGEYELARSDYEESKQLFESIDDSEGIADVSVAVGKMAEKQDDHQLARSAYVDSLAANWADLRQSPTLNPADRELDCDRSMLIEALENRSYEEARECFADLFEGSHETRFEHRHAAVLATMASVARLDGASERAESLSSAALDRYPEEGTQADRADILEELGDLALTRNDPESAFTHFEESRHLNQRLGRRAKEADVLGSLISVAETLGDDSAVDEFTQDRDALTASPR